MYIGMMDAAYFTGRKELLEFFNELLDLNLTKIEQTAPGAIACQMADIIFPNTIPMSKVNWEARSDYEFVQNYKLLQNAFNKNHVQRYVDVDKLIRAKYQDNLEFCQWMKAFYDQSGVHRPDYDPRVVRARGKGGKKFNMLHNKTGGVRSAARKPTVRSTAKPAAPKPVAAKKPVARPLRENEGNKPVSNVEPKTVPDPALIAENETLKAQVTELETNLASMEEAVAEVEQERQFYFEKLRDVEVLLQVYQERKEEDAETSPDPTVEKVFKILYAVRVVVM